MNAWGAVVLGEASMSNQSKSSGGRSAITPPALPPRLRLLVASYATAALGSFLIVFAAYGYTTSGSYDSWLTPRWTQYMIFQWYVGTAFGPLAFLGVIVGLILLATSRDLRNSGLMWVSFLLFVLSLGFVHPG
jgi:hypothetical protein